MKIPKTLPDQMTNKAQKVVVLSFLSLVLITRVFAGDVTFSVSPVYRTSWGTVHEYVFWDNDSNGSNEYMRSRLDWDIDAIPAIGGEASISYTTDLRHIFTLNGSFVMGESCRSGVMQDYDWSHLENGRFCGTLTNYSIHNNTLTDLSEFSVGGEWRTPVGIGITIGWDIRTIAFAASGGYSQYGEEPNPGTGIYDHVDLETEPKNYVSDQSKVVGSYEYQFNYLKTGITYSLGSVRGPRFYCGIWGIPLCAAVGKDYHYARNGGLGFYDNMYGYLCGATEVVSITIPLFKGLSIYFKEEGEYLATIKGLTYRWNGKTTPYKNDQLSGGGGSGFERFTVSGGLTLTF